MPDLDVVVLGGCGHVGLPLGIVMADVGLKVALYDTNEAVVRSVAEGVMPFDEPDADKLLREVLAGGQLSVTSSPEILGHAEVVVIVVGTPIDEHLNPDLFAVPRAIEGVIDHLVDGQLLVLRSTLYPGVTDLVQQVLVNAGLDVDIAFCPERIAEGKALVELRVLPQIVSGCSARAVERAEALFTRIVPDIVRLEPLEAELAKLFTNTWRYIKFAVANQYYMIANDYGLDFETIRAALTYKYPRAVDLPRAGFAAGPCLFKDAMQLAAFNDNGFTLGHASMTINEGLPLYLVSRAERRWDLSKMTVGILGMAFKADSDDNRASLSYKLKRILRFKANRVLCSDPHVKNDAELVPLSEVLGQADLVFIGAPHSAYVDLDLEVPVVDIWNLFGNGVGV